MKKTILFGEKDRTFLEKRLYFSGKKTVLFFHNPSPTTSEQIARIVIYY